MHIPIASCAPDICPASLSGLFSKQNTEGRLQRYGNRPSRMIHTHVRLVNPCTRQIQTRRDAFALPRLILRLLHGRLERARASCFQSLVRSALQLDVLYSAFLTQPAFLLAATFRVHHEDVRLHNVQSRDEVYHPMPLVYISLDPIPTYRSPNLEACWKNSTCPLCSRS